MSILLIEDARQFAKNLKRALEIEGYAVDIAHDGEAGFRRATKREYDLIILDLMLPKKDGVDIAREVRERGIDVPIIMLTARGTMDDRVMGLDAGADDYLVKPFKFPELFARIRSQLRRKRKDGGAPLTIADLELNPATHEATRAGVRIPLTPKEYSILDYLLRYKGEVLSRTTLAEHLWAPEKKNSENKLDVQIRYLRKKIDEGHEKKLVRTVKGVGYKIAEK